MDNLSHAVSGGGRPGAYLQSPPPQRRVHRQLDAKRASWYVAPSARLA